MGEKETAERSVGAGQVTEIIERRAQDPPAGGGGTPLETSNLNLSKSNINREGGHTAGSEDDAGRLSTNMTIERQTPKRDFGD